MTMRDYLTIIRRRWLLIATFTTLGILAAIAILATVPPTFTAESRVLVSLNNARTPAELEHGNNFIQTRTRSYVVAAKSPFVLDPVINQLGLPENAASLGRKIEATAELNTVVITISVSDPSAARAATIAESLTRHFIRSIEDNERPPDSTVSLVKLSIIAPAREPDTPSAPNRNVVLAVGTLAGLGLGLALALALNLRNFRIRSVQELGRLTPLPILGTLVLDATSPKRARERSPLQFSRSESYREIRNTLLASTGPGNKRTVLITSSLPEEGKSLIAVDLAISLSQVGQEVILVDANVRFPSLAQDLGLRPAPGLSDVLNGRFETKDVLHKIGTHDLDVLVAGNRVLAPAELVDSHALADLVDDAGHNYDTVILDGSALTTDADAAVLSSQVDGVILVARLGKSSSRELKRALMLLESSGGTVLGIIVNSLSKKKGRRAEILHETRRPYAFTERARQRAAAAREL